MKKLKFIITLVVALAVVFLGLKYVDSKKIKNKKVAGTLQESTTLKTFSGYGIKFQYPADWTVDTSLSLKLYKGDLASADPEYLIDSSPVYGETGILWTGDCDDRENIFRQKVHCEKIDVFNPGIPDLLRPVYTQISLHTSSSNPETLAILSQIVKSANGEAPVQEGLPPLVAAKREAIFQAALSRDLEKLKAESSDSDMLASFDMGGKSKFGLSGFTKLIDREKNITIFSLIPALLRSPYSVTDNLYYTWPSVATKTGQDFTPADLEYMNGFLTTEQIELFKGYYYTYPKITITSEGEWINHPFFND